MCILDLLCSITYYQHNDVRCCTHTNNNINREIYDCNWTTLTVETQPKGQYPKHPLHVYGRGGR